MNKILVPMLALITLTGTSLAEPAQVLKEKSETALRHLYRTNPGAQAIGEKSLAVLVFPEIYKAGFIFGAQRGDGVLFKDGAVDGYFNTTSASYGLQAGIQKFSYALSNSISTTTTHQGIYVFFFSQQGLMAGIGIQGTKITKFTPSE